MRHKKWNNNKVERATWFSCHLRLSRRLDWLWKIMAKKEKRRRRRQRGPRGCYCGHAVILCLRGEAGNHLGSTYITYTHFHHKFIRHSRFSLSVSLFPGTLHNAALFIQHYLFVFPINPGSSFFSWWEREREGLLLVITVKIIFWNYRW